MHFHIISKSQAKSLGIKFYFTGKPCKHGHIAERMVSKSTCRECNRVNGLKYYKENKPEISLYNKQYREENKEQIATYRKENKERARKANKDYYASNKDSEKKRSKQWYENNYSRIRERRLEYCRIWRMNNPDVKKKLDLEYSNKNKDKIKAKRKEYYESNKSLISLRCKEYRSKNLDKHNASSAERRSAKKRAIPKWYNKNKVNKLYSKARDMGLTVDHIVPLKSDLVCGLHCWHNLQLLEQSENSSKGNYYWPDMP